MRFTRPIILTVALLCAPSVAHAVPVLVTFGGIFHTYATAPDYSYYEMTSNPLNGQAYFGSFLYNEPPCPYPTDLECLGGGNQGTIVDVSLLNVPMLSFAFHLGPYSFTGADLVGGGMVRAYPYMVWGPLAEVKASSLPPGFNSIWFGADSNIAIVASGDTWSSGLEFPQFFIQKLPQSVPEPAALAFGLAATGLFALSRKGRS